MSTLKAYIRYIAPSDIDLIRDMFNGDSASAHQAWKLHTERRSQASKMSSVARQLKYCTLLGHVCGCYVCVVDCTGDHNFYPDSKAVCPRGR